MGPYDATHRRPVDQSESAPLRWLAAQQHVAGHIEVVELVQLLVDERDPERRRRVDVADHDTRAVEEHISRIRLLDASDDLHQGGLTRTVLTQQRNDLSGLHVEAHAAQGVNAWKMLVDAAKLKDRYAHLV